VPRPVRVEIEGGLYHVYNRIGQGQQPFGESDEAGVFVELLREAKTRDEFVVFAWAVLSNHYLCAAAHK
jgi:putative transposase